MAKGSTSVVFIGGSAGALDALSEILRFVTPTFAAPMVVVLHIPPKPSPLVSVLASKCALPVSEPEDKELLQVGRVYVAPPNYHTLIEDDLSCALSIDEPTHFSRPSIDVLFESAAHALGPKAVGVLLSGGNDDGAEGLKAIADAGGTTLVQHPETAMVSSMPVAALNCMRPTHVLAPSDIGHYLRRTLGGEEHL